MKYLKYFSIPLLIIISYQILTNSSIITKCIIFSFNIWKNNIFPSLFPFLIISFFFINYGMVELLSELLKPLMHLFKINDKCSFIFVMSILSGFPSSAVTTKKLYDEKIINKYDASKILLFSHFSNPLFLLTNLSLYLNLKDVIVIIIIHYLSNIIIGLLFRNYYPTISSSKININNMINSINARLNKSSSIGKVINDAIKSSLETLLTILGTITIFLCITTIINKHLNFNPIISALINGLFEITQGIKYISILNISSNIKGILSIFIISFGGLSIHTQIISIISDTDIKYYPYLIVRIIHAFISSFILYIYYLCT